MRSGSPSEPSLIFSKRTRGGFARGVRHCLRRAERDRVGRGQRMWGGQSGEFVDRLSGLLGFQVPERAIERIAGGARRHRRLQQRRGSRPCATLPANSFEQSCHGLRRFRRSGHKERIRRGPKRDLGTRPATIPPPPPVASVLAPRLMVNCPAMGQLSMRTVSLGPGRLTMMKASLRSSRQSETLC